MSTRLFDRRFCIVPVLMFGVGAINKRHLIESVHRNDVIEIFEVFNLYTSRVNIGERITTSLCSGARPPVGRLTSVIRVRAR